MKFCNSFAVFTTVSLVILYLKLTAIAVSAEVRIINIGRVNSKLVCQGRTAKLRCNNTSHAMVVYAATYGRTVEGRVLCQFNDKIQPSVILANDTDDSSDKATNCGEANVTLQIIKMCDKRRRCILTANETYLGNPCKGVYKYLNIIYACEDKNKPKITTYPTYPIGPTSDTASPTLSTVRNTRKRTRPTRATPTRKKTTTLTKRKKTLTNTTARKKTRSTRAPKVTKSTTAPTPKKPIDKSTSTTSKVSLKSTTSSPKSTNKALTPSTVTALSKKPTVKPNITVLIPDISTPVNPTVVSTNVTFTTGHNNTIKTPTTSTGTPLNITTPSTGTTITYRKRTTPSTFGVKPGDESTRPASYSSKGPAVAAVRQEVSLGVTGSLYLWFLHLKENSSDYLTIFLLSAFGAILMVVAVAACVFTLQKKKDFLKLDIMHKPRRFIALPAGTKKTNQNGHVPGKGEKLPDGEEMPDGMMLLKGPEVVFTAHDVSNHVTKEFNIDRYSGVENGGVHKGDGSGVHINPLFNGNNNNRNPSSVSNPNQGNHQVASGPPTPARSRNFSDTRAENAKRTRCNSTGNVSRNHDRHHGHGTSNVPDNRVRLPRHLSAGNVSQQRQATHLEHNPQNLSPAKTLPRQSAKTIADGSVGQSPVRTHAHGHPNAPRPQSPMKTVPGVLNPYQPPVASPYNRQHSTGSGNQQLLSPSKSAQYDTRSRADRPFEYGSRGRDGETTVQGAQDSLIPYQQLNPTPVIITNSASQAPGQHGDGRKSSSPDEGSKMPYSPHRTNPRLNGQWSEEKPKKETTPTITTNPIYNPGSKDVWRKQQQQYLNTGESETSVPSSSVEHGSTPEGILLQKRKVSDPSSSQEPDPDKGTMRSSSSIGELLSPLDALPEGNANTRGLRFSDRHSYNLNPGSSSFHPLPPPPPELLTDSSDDDLYSIVAKGTYSSAAPDPNLRHSPESDTAAGGRGKSKKTKHVAVTIPSVAGSTEV